MKKDNENIQPTSKILILEYIIIIIIIIIIKVSKLFQM